MTDIKASETGFDRLKTVVTSSKSEFYENASQAVFFGSITGFLIGGRMGARVSGNDHMISNQLTIYPSKMQAHREYHSAVVKGFVRNGSRWGWRLGLFAGIYSAFLTVLTEYRDKEDALNLVAAGAATGTAYKLFSGVRGIIVGTIFGTCFSIPIALAVQGIVLVLPSEIKENYVKLRLERRKMKEEDKSQQDLTEADNLLKQWEGNLNYNNYEDPDESSTSSG